MAACHVFLLLSLASLAISKIDKHPGWVCKNLEKIIKTDSCFTKSSLNNLMKNAEGGKFGLCAITLAPTEGPEKFQHFYMTAEITNKYMSPFTNPGFVFNSDGNGNYDYLLTRWGDTFPWSKFEHGYLKNGEKTLTDDAQLGKYSSTKMTLAMLLDEDGVVFWSNSQQLEMKETVDIKEPGNIGIGLFRASPGEISISNAQVCYAPEPCIHPDGTVIQAGDSYDDDTGKTCTCSSTSQLTCVCPSSSKVCSAPNNILWQDADTCEAICIPGPGYCTSSGDPHYRSFDNKYYDFHGKCTYTAATCDDFKVNFKNVDLLNRAPRYTYRIEVEFRGEVFAIQAGSVAKVDENIVQVPYEKVYTNGDRIEILNNGQLEIRLYSKGRNPSVRARANNAGRYINAELWLHGSCQDTEGLCGNFNRNPNDDLLNSDPNFTGEQYKKYDENCPAPPAPWHPCDLVVNGKALASNVCDQMKAAPFTACHNAVPPGDVETGKYADCVADVCNCFIEKVCACDVFDMYAEECVRKGVDLADWRTSVDYCPFKCPDGLKYKAKGTIPTATCLKRNPENTGETARGCYCPNDKILQDGKCVDESECKCLHEGNFYKPGQTFDKEGECKTCECKTGGVMDCGDKACPVLNCQGDELVVQDDDECCPYCEDEWVTAQNPDNTIQKGQNVDLICQVDALGIKKQNIKWYKKTDGKLVEITDGISKDRLKLKLKKQTSDGTYVCRGDFQGKVKDAEFEVDVVISCEHEDGTVFTDSAPYKPDEHVTCTCVKPGVHECQCTETDDCPEGQEAWFDSKCVKTCVPAKGMCTAAMDPHYTTFDGKKFDFKGECEYTFFSCGDLAIHAIHETVQKDGKDISSKTKTLEVLFMNDVFALEKGKVKLGNKNMKLPFHKKYSDKSIVTIADTGKIVVTLQQNGKNPLAELTFDKDSSYTLKAHGSCYGNSGGICGKWNGNMDDDFTKPDGTLADTAAAFGDSWAHDEEAECSPAPPNPPVDICGNFEIDRAPHDTFVNNIFDSGEIKKCKGIVDQDKAKEQAVQDVCMCFSEQKCACPIIGQYVDECKNKGVQIGMWELTTNGECSVECPDKDMTYKEGPKPAPTCSKPKGGKKKQFGCYCPDGKILEDGKCIDKGDCKCEYAGQLFNVGDKITKEEICKVCTCKKGGDQFCLKMSCRKCKKGQLEVKEDGQCCATCMEDWLTAVKPVQEGKHGDELLLTCKVKDGVTIDTMKWMHFNPNGVEISDKNKAFTIGEAGLVLKIKKLTAKTIGEFKCVAEVGGKQAQGEFEISLDVTEDDLVTPNPAEVVLSKNGDDLKFKCDKNKGKTIVEITWSCDDKRVKDKKNKYAIVNKKGYSMLTVMSVKKGDLKACTCHAIGLGSKEDEEINVKEEKEPTCDITGQEHTECGSNCGDLTCDKPKPPKKCKEKCKARCQCPASKPILHENGCIKLDECPVKYEVKVDILSVDCSKAGGKKPINKCIHKKFVKKMVVTIKSDKKITKKDIKLLGIYKITVKDNEIVGKPTKLKNKFKGKKTIKIKGKLKQGKGKEVKYIVRYTKDGKDYDSDIITIKS